MSELELFLKRTFRRKAKIAVVGDAMIDEYYVGIDASRVSPEFPIPVLKSETANCSVAAAGGAANVVSQFKYFNVDVDFYGLSNKYLNSLMKIRNSLDNHDFDVPLKRRFYQSEFPLCRWDVEKLNYGLNQSQLYQIQKELFDSYINSDIEVAVFADYNKGMFNLNDFQWFSRPDIITIVDPKALPIEKWRGCSIFKPNEKEAKDLSGLSDWRKQCDYFQNQLHCISVVITHGGQGVVGKVGHKYFEYKPCKEKIAESVIGAGDCFCAFLALTQAYSIDLEKAVEIAWEAGAIYVQRKHNRPVSPAELCGKRAFPELLANRNFDLVWTNGCFDLLGPHHLEILKYSKSLGSKLVVGINTDESIKKLKGNDRPIRTLEDRIKMLESLEFVDYIVPFDEETPLSVIEKIKPDKIVKGGDYKQDSVVGVNVVGKDNVFIFPLLEGQSTTGLIKKIKSN